MNTKKVHLYLTAFSLLFMSIGTIFASDNIIFWMSSTSISYELIRILLLVVLIIQMLTNPPRHPSVRIGTGLVSLMVLSWSITQTYNMSMLLMDTLLFIGSSLVVGVTAIELNYFAKDEKLLTSA